MTFSAIELKNLVESRMELQLKEYSVCRNNYFGWRCSISAIFWSVEDWCLFQSHRGDLQSSLRFDIIFLFRSLHSDVIPSLLSAFRCHSLDALCISTSFPICSLRSDFVPVSCISLCILMSNCQFLCSPIGDLSFSICILSLLHHSFIHWVNFSSIVGPVLITW